MKGIRRAAALFLIPLLVVLMAAPVMAAPGNGTPKTNQEHEAWLVLDPVPATTDAGTVTITGKVAGNFNMTVRNGSFVKEFVAKGHFSVEVDLFAGENPIKISGIDKAGRLLNYELSVTKSGGEDPQPQLFLSARVNGTLQSDGQSQAQLEVTVAKSTGGVADTYTSPISVSSSDPNSLVVVESPVTPSGGVAYFPLRAGTAYGWVSLTITAPGLTSTTLPVQVEQAPPTDLHLSLSLTGSLQVGSLDQATLTIAVLDPANQPFAGFHDPITLETSDPDIVQVPVRTVFAVGGVATSSLTAGTLPGAATVTVRGPGLTPATISVTVSPAPAPVLTLTWSSVGSLRAYSQSQMMVTMQVVNAATGAPVTSFTDPITVTSSDPAAARVLMSPAVPVNGAATTYLASGTSSAPATITLTAPGLTGVSFTVTPKPPAPSSLALGLEGVLVAGSPSLATLTVTVLDAGGQPVPAYNQPIGFTSSDTNVLVVTASPVTPSNGVASTVLAAGTTAGTAIVTVTAPGLSPVNLAVTVEPPMPPHLSMVVIGSLVANNQSLATLNITVVDENGTIARTFAEPLHFASSAPEAVQVVTPVVVPANGVATVTLKSGSAAMPATITGTATGLQDSAIVVTPAAQVPTHLTLTADPLNLGMGSSSVGKLYLGLKDQTGIAMLQLASPLQLRLTSSNAGAVHFGGGQSTLDVTMTSTTALVALYGGTGVGSSNISGMALGGGLSSDTVTVNSIETGVPYQFAIDSISGARVGQAQVVTVRLLDVFGFQVSDGFGTADSTVSVRNPDGSTTVLGTVSMVNGYGTLTFTPTMAGQYSLTAEGSWWGYPLVPGGTGFTVAP